MIVPCLIIKADRDTGDTHDPAPTPGPDDFWKRGGQIYQDCVQWEFSALDEAPE